MFQSKLPNMFWSYAIVHFVYLINWLPSSVIRNKCPYEILYNCILSFSNLRVFICMCFSSTLEENRNKLDPMAHKCIFLDFKEGTKCYIIIDIHSR